MQSPGIVLPIWDKTALPNTSACTWDVDVLLVAIAVRLDIGASLPAEAKAVLVTYPTKIDVFSGECTPIGTGFLSGEAQSMV